MLHFKTIKNRIRFYFLFSITIVIFTVGLFAVMQFERNLERQIQGNQRQISQQLYLNVDKELHDGLNDIAILQNSRLIKSDIVTAESKRAELENFKKIYKDYEALALLDKKGSPIASTDYRIGGEWKYYPFFTKALEGTSVISNAFFISNPLRLVFALSVPIENISGETMGVIVALINADNIIEINNQSKVGKTGFSLVLDEYNKIIAAPDREWLLTTPSELVSKDKEGTTINFKGEQYFYALYKASDLKEKNVHHGNLKVYTMQKSSEIINSLKADTYKISLMMFVLAIIFIVLVYHLSYVLTRPIESLIQGFERIARGEYDKKIEIISSDEMGNLLISFNHLAEKLQASDSENKKHHLEMENLVAQRTVELQDKIEELQKFNLYATKRELKMVELKEKIKKLEESQT